MTILRHMSNFIHERVISFLYSLNSRSNSLLFEFSLIRVEIFLSENTETSEIFGLDYLPISPLISSFEFEYLFSSGLDQRGVWC